MGSYIISIAKTVSRKIGALIQSIKFLFPEGSVYLYKSTISPCIEYCCHVWEAALSSYLQLLVKLQKWICRTVGPSLVASLEPLAHRRNVASVSLFFRYYFGKCYQFLFFFFFLSVILSMQGWIATTRHGVTRKRNTKRLRHAGNLFRKSLQLKDVS